MALKSGGNAADNIAVGTTAQRPNTPVQGDLRFGLDSQHPEIYTGNLSRVSGWKLIAYVGTPDAVPGNLTISRNTTGAVAYYVNDLTIKSGVTISGSHTTFVCTGNVNIENNVTINFANSGIPGSGGCAITPNEVDPIPGNGLSPGTASYNLTSPPVSLYAYSSSSGASGGKPPRYDGTNGVGGASGGSIIIMANGSVTLGTGVSFKVDGRGAYNDNSAGKPTFGGGGGGGAAGFVVIQSGGDFTMGSGGSISAKGGAGANGVTGGAGGGGGGGGYVILGARDGKFTMSTPDSAVNVAGGPRGVRTAGTGGKRGGGGGACGGKGGNLVGGYEGSNGGTGQYLKDFIIG